MNIPPKETIYKGYRFRSRLEARWAVFFEYANIQYEYEYEGFDIGEDKAYLPDFYLPDFDLWVEIKPFDRSVVRHVGDWNKWEQTCSRFRDATGNAILLCYGPPSGSVFHLLFAYDCGEDSGGTCEACAIFGDFSPNDNTVLLVDWPNSHDMYLNDGFTLENPNVRIAKSQEWSEAMELLNPFDKSGLQYSNTGRAMLASRQARFEYENKETPIIK